MANTTIELTRRTTNKPINIAVSSILKVMPNKDGSNIEAKVDGGDSIIYSVTETDREVWKRVAAARQEASES